MTTHEDMRRRLLERAGVFETPEGLDIKALLKSEWCEEFEAGRRRRMVLGAFRYSPLRAQRDMEYDCVGSIISRARRYYDDGNLEHLMDIANIAMVEYATGRHPKRHFSSVDDGEHTRSI